MLKNKTEILSAAEYRKRYGGDVSQAQTDKKQPAKKTSPEKQYIDTILRNFNMGFISEHKFLEKRKFRFDWACVEKKIAVEYEGIMASKARHTTVTGYSKDTEKYNLAVIHGWRVLRYTTLTYKNIYDDIISLLNCEF